jgi:hypothetical protein
MPSIEKHIETSLKRTGKKYLEVHEWIDDPATKIERHDINAIPDNFQMFKEKYGEEAAREYVQHLSDDIKGRFGHVLEDFEKEMAAAIKYFGSK